MPIRVLVNGATGRMGKMTTQGLSAHPDFDLVGTVGRLDNLQEILKASRPDVVIDFTKPEVVFENATEIIAAGIHPVIGTTGLSTEQIHRLQEQAFAKKLGGIIAPNFSLGAMLMIKYAQEIVKYFPHVEIIEMHHQHKADSPSGTALRTAISLSSVNVAINQKNMTSHETLPGARGATHEGIPIHSIRLPGLLAHEQIIFGNQGETLTLRHDTIDRECYLPGILLACQKVMSLDRLVYGLEEVL